MKRKTKTVVWAVSQVIAAMALTALLGLSVGCNRTGSHTLHILSTGDVHGAWFDSTYSGSGLKCSLFAVNTYVDSLRAEFGDDNVLLIDAGDVLQGDNAAYYFNYENTDAPHLYPRLAAYMGYDAVTVGNHDIETGHPVYDKVNAQLRKAGIPWLGGNALDKNGKPYFTEYKVFKRAGLKVLVLGYTNPNIPAWLGESLWSGMKFESLLPFVQQRVDAVKARVRPDVTVVVVHSGTGDGDGSELESQGLELFESLAGVDVLITAHDHRPTVKCSDGIVLVNSGSKAYNLGHVSLTADLKGGKVVSRQSSAEIIKVDRRKADPEMREAFAADFEKVRNFTNSEVGKTAFEIRTRDAYAGQSPYMDLIHTAALWCTGAQLSISAPLTFNAVIPEGKLVFNDMFVIYPYENGLYKISLTGRELKDYMERNYDDWICTFDGEHVLKIVNVPDTRTGLKRWSFMNRSFNFDSVAGINYTVDVTRPAGERIEILSLADGSAFDLDATYSVAANSYRCAGRGWNDRVEEKYPEYREVIYKFIKEKGTLREDDIAGTGSWSFVPKDIADKAISNDMSLIFN